MGYLEQLFSSLGGMAGVGILAGGLGVAYSQFKSGGNKAKDELIATLKETAIAEKVRAERLAAEKVTLLDSHQKQINELNNQLGKLQGLYESAEKRNREMMEILQGRSPEQTKFMELMTKAATESGKTTVQAGRYMEETTAALKAILAFMEALDKKATENSERIKRVDNKKLPVT